jgi:K+-sensing histidine kinase KdpD
MHEDEIRLSVTNEGPLIPKEVLDSLFHGMYSRRPDRSVRPHLGIGLYIANRIARQHDGDLRVTNSADKQRVSACLKLPVERAGLVP